MKRRIGMILIGAIAPISASADMLPLERGFYVTVDTPCSEASNATITLYDGAQIGAAHQDCRAPSAKRMLDGSYRVTTKCRDTEGRGGQWQSETTVYHVETPTKFAMSSVYGDQAYRLCPQSELPSPWRDTNIAALAKSPT